MNMKPDASPLSPAAHFVAALLATIITVGIFSSLTELFLRNGRPLERWAAAESACASHDYVSEREACMRQWAALQPSVRLAGNRGI